MWEDFGNGTITRKPKPKMIRVVFREETAPDDRGRLRLKVDAENGGSAPRIHYQEDGTVISESPVLSENTLTTSALRVQFLTIDRTGKNQTGLPVTRTNRLTIRSRFDESTNERYILKIWDKNLMIISKTEKIIALCPNFISRELVHFYFPINRCVSFVTP